MEAEANCERGDEKETSVRYGKIRIEEI